MTRVPYEEKLEACKHYLNINGWFLLGYDEEGSREKRRIMYVVDNEVITLKVYSMYVRVLRNVLNIKPSLDCKMEVLCKQRNLTFNGIVVKETPTNTYKYIHYYCEKHGDNKQILHKFKKNKYCCNNLNILKTEKPKVKYKREYTFEESINNAWFRTKSKYQLKGKMQSREYFSDFMRNKPDELVVMYDLFKVGYVDEHQVFLMSEESRLIWNNIFNKPKRNSLPFGVCVGRTKLNFHRGYTYSDHKGQKVKCETVEEAYAGKLASLELRMKEFMSRPDVKENTKLVDRLQNTDLHELCERYRLSRLEEQHTEA